ncbi:MAG: ABC transporter permease [Turicibacter sp.]|nr:ABC transporter permease [Turicibacter sp.]
MTKKHYLATTTILTLALFLPFWQYLPMEVAGHRPGNIPMQIFYAALMSATTAIIATICTIIATRRTFIRTQLATLARFRHLLFLMIKRDFVTRYRRNVLGVLWSLLNPLMTMLVLTMVFSMLFRFDIPNFPVYLLSGQLIFNFFSEATTRAMGSVLGGAGTIKKVYVPKYIFPASAVLSSVVNLAFAFVAFLFVYAITGEPLRWTLLLVPLPILYVFTFSLGLGMLLSSMAVFFRDITYLYGIAMTLLMFLTPIFYPVTILPDRIFHLIHLNPMFHYVSYFRELALYGTIPGLWANMLCLGFALAALCVGLFATMTQQDKFILYL